MKVKVNFKIQVDNVACPCGGTVQIGYMDDVPCSTHTLPYCNEFEDKNLIDFVHYLNQQRLH